jgi:hypothetical protein
MRSAGGHGGGWWAHQVGQTMAYRLGRLLKTARSKETTRFVQASAFFTIFLYLVFLLISFLLSSDEREVIDPPFEAIINFMTYSEVHPIPILLFLFYYK